MPANKERARARSIGNTLPAKELSYALDMAERPSRFASPDLQARSSARVYRGPTGDGIASTSHGGNSRLMPSNVTSGAITSKIATIKPSFPKTWSG